MTSQDRDTLSRKLDDLSKRIKSHRDHLAGRPDAPGKLRSITERHQQLRAKLDAAHGPVWEKEREHIAREHGLLFEALTDLERKLDEEQIHPSGRAAGARSGLI
jgi:hypothetical protein